MKQFKQLRDGGFLDIASGAAIPNDPANRHRREIAEAVKRGEAVILAADPTPLPPTADEAILQGIGHGVLREAVLTLAAKVGLTPGALVAEIKARRLR